MELISRPPPSLILIQEPTELLSSPSWVITKGVPVSASQSSGIMSVQPHDRLEHTILRTEKKLSTEWRKLGNWWWGGELLTSRNQLWLHRRQKQFLILFTCCTRQALPLWRHFGRCRITLMTKVESWEEHLTNIWNMRQVVLQLSILLCG